MTRPVAFFYESCSGPVAGPSHYCPSTGCTGPSWSEEVLSLGTPAIWWGPLRALAFWLGRWLLHRDWRGPAGLVGTQAGCGARGPRGRPRHVFDAPLEALPGLVAALG